MNAAVAVPLLCLAFLLSGAAALVLETLWFRLLGLTLGNTIWASTTVLAAFMGGLGLGNALAARYAPRVRRPVAAYAVLELAIAVTGVGLALLLPRLTVLLADVMAPIRDAPLLLGAFRLGVAWLLLVVPCTAMGAGLPLAVKALSAWDSRLGRNLGLLYGFNTLGAMAGAWGGEVLLIRQLGLTGTAWTAAGLQVLAAALALVLSRRLGPMAVEAGDRTPAPRAPASRRLLLAAALGGALLLALEVVWFRFLQMFVQGTALSLAIMLAVVLGGIAAGGLVASAWASRTADAHRHAAAVAAAAGAATLGSYVSFPYAGWFVLDPGPTAMMAVRLMAVTSVLSGLLFTFIGAALADRTGEPARTTGLLTLANTAGGVVGVVAGGFVLLPGLGVEGSFLVLGAGYLLVALLILAAAPALRPVGRDRAVLAIPLAASAGLLLLFPHGLMADRFVARSMARYTQDGSRVVALREGLTETIVYLRAERWGLPYYHRLVTNGYSMSASDPFARRYMKLFAYWPAALTSEPRSALLVSFGVGSTARALVEMRSLRRIDVVDVSRDVLELGRIVHAAGAYPLDDPRVDVHVEDGRFFLATTAQSYDLITSEPPPPKNAGIDSLYSREYFELVHARLADGGIATHWLPVSQLTPDDARAIVRAFCDVFDDCSLWNGAGWDWMLAGSRGGIGRVDEATLTAPWADPAMGPELRAIGIETPAQLGALFLADAEQLDALASMPPLVDDRPGRLAEELPEHTDPFFASVADVDAARARFRDSAWARRTWPPELREETLDAFAVQRYWSGEPAGWDALMAVLRDTGLRTLPLHMAGSTADEQRLATLAREAGREGDGLLFRSGLGALADRDPRRAERFFAASGDPRQVPILLGWRVLALCLAGARDEAIALAGELAPAVPIDPAVDRWLQGDDGSGACTPGKVSGRSRDPQPAGGAGGSSGGGARPPGRPRRGGRRRSLPRRQPRRN